MYNYFALYEIYVSDRNKDWKNKLPAEMWEKALGNQNGMPLKVFDDKEKALIEAINYRNKMAEDKRNGYGPKNGKYRYIVKKCNEYGEMEKFGQMGDYNLRNKYI